jgi:hypothetical protein
MKYCAMTAVGKHFGTLFPEVYEDGGDSSEDEDDWVETEPENDFTRYEGPDELMNSINRSYDSWDSWEPTCPAEHMLKNAIEKTNSHR